MTRTIVALYDDIVMARQVVEDLVNADFARSSISLITNDANNQYGHYLDKDYAPRNDAVTASEGATFGALVGVLTGFLAGVAALAIPGIGLVIAAGPIVAGITGALAGTVTGGIVGALVKTGIPQDTAPYFAEGIRRGGTLVSVETDDMLRAQDIINRHGAINIHERANTWRQAGWQGLDAAVESLENEAAVQPHPVMLAPTPLHVKPIAVAPMLESEPPFNDEDTSKSLPVLVNARANDTPIVTPAMPNMLITAEPGLVVVENEAKSEYEDTSKSVSDY